MARSLFVALVVVVSGCASHGASGGDRGASTATQALRRGDLDHASKEAGRVLGADPENSHAAAVRALSRYERAMRQLAIDVRTIAVSGAAFGGVNHRYFRSALTEGERELALVDADLAIVDRDERCALDLCLACWERDWNANGRIDESDRLLFQVERDADGNPIPEADPRRKPTFRFDHGDVSWARAFVAFQRAIIDFVLAYDGGDLDGVLATGSKKRVVRIRLLHPERVRAAREQLWMGLRRSRAARAAYLAETDDEREWMPNPRQKNHPLPMPVDDALYETWDAVIGDLERLLDSREGLSVAELQALDHGRSSPRAKGYLDFGRLLSDPRDIVIDLDALEAAEKRGAVDGMMKSTFGRSYVRSMRPSPLIGRLRRMKGEVDRGDESLERKLRYLLWIN